MGVKHKKIVWLLALTLWVSACSAVKIQVKKTSYTAPPVSLEGVGAPYYVLNVTTPFALSANNKIVFNHLKEEVDRHPRFSVGPAGLMDMIKYDLSLDISTDYEALSEKVTIKIRGDLMMNKVRLEEFVLEEFVSVTVQHGFGTPSNVIADSAIRNIFIENKSLLGAYVTDVVLKKLDLYAREIEDSR